MHILTIFHFEVEEQTDNLFPLNSMIIPVIIFSTERIQRVLLVEAFHRTLPPALPSSFSGTPICWTSSVFPKFPLMVTNLSNAEFKLHHKRSSLPCFSRYYCRYHYLLTLALLTEEQFIAANGLPSC